MRDFVGISIQALFFLSICIFLSNLMQSVGDSVNNAIERLVHNSEEGDRKKRSKATSRPKLQQQLQSLPVVIGNLKK